MELSLSPRLMTCCRYVRAGSRVGDIGCDHGYLGIYLLKNGLADFVYAGDVNKAPLQSAIHNAEKYGVSSQISFFLSDGLKQFPRDFDTAVCAGMGADTMVSILENAPWIKDSRYRLILQCQSKTPYLRKYLSDSGFIIEEESVLRDGRFLYTVMVAVYRPGNPLSAAECYISPALFRSGCQELPAYFRQVLSRLKQAVNGQKEKADPNIVAVLQTLSMQYTDLINTISAEE